MAERTLDAIVEFEEQDVEEDLELEESEQQQEQEEDTQHDHQQRQPSATAANIDDATLDAFLADDDDDDDGTDSPAIMTNTTITATSTALGAAQAAAFAAALQQRGVSTQGVLLPQSASHLAATAARRPMEASAGQDDEHQDAAFEEEDVEDDGDDEADTPAPQLQSPPPPPVAARECSTSSSNGSRVQDYAQAVLLPTPAATPAAPQQEQVAADQEASPSRLPHEGGGGSIRAGRAPQAGAACRPQAQTTTAQPSSSLPFTPKQRPSSASTPGARRPSSSIGGQRERQPWRGPQDSEGREEEGGHVQDAGAASVLPVVLPPSSWTGTLQTPVDVAHAACMPGPPQTQQPNLYCLATVFSCHKQATLSQRSRPACKPSTRVHECSAQCLRLGGRPGAVAVPKEVPAPLHRWPTAAAPERGAAAH